MTRSQHGVPYKTWLLRMGDFGLLAASPSPLQLFLREAENPWLPLSFTQPSSEHLDSLIKSLFLRLLLLPKALLPGSSHSLKNLRKTQGTNLILQHWSGIAIPASRERGARQLASGERGTVPATSEAAAFAGDSTVCGGTLELSPAETRSF